MAGSKFDKQVTFFPYGGVNQYVAFAQGVNASASGVITVNGGPGTGEGSRIDINDVLMQVLAIALAGTFASAMTTTVVDITNKCAITAANQITITGDADRSAGTIMVVTYAKKRYGF